MTRFETIRRGTLIVDEAPALDVRLVRDADPPHRYLVVIGPVHPEQSFATEEDAVRSLPPDGPGLRVEWVASVGPGPSEVPCPTCGAGRQAWARYPGLLCAPCVLEAVDETGRPLRFQSGARGFEARYADTGEPRSVDACFVRGIACRAEEGYFGTIVVMPRR